VRLAALTLAVLASVAGCELSSGEDEQPDRSTRPELRSPAGRLIRDWLMALEREDYVQAASYFARGAIVDQGRAFRLDGPVEARFFNATLPCRADLVRLRDEGAGEVLATFRLRTGPGGPCDGFVQVRYTIEHGKFTEWHQLPEPTSDQAPA